MHVTRYNMPELGYRLVASEAAWLQCSFIHSFILLSFRKSIQKTLDVEIVTDKTVQCT
jgi:hypothetical protein